MQELGVAADHRRPHASEATGVDRALLEAGDLVGMDGLGLALELELTDVDGLDELADEAVRGGRNEDIARAGGCLHAGRYVDRVAHGGVLRRGLGADDADDDRSCVDADSDLESVSLGQMLGGIELVDRSHKVEAAANGTLGVILVGGRGAEEGEYAVPHEAGDGPSVTLDGSVHPLECLTDEGGPVLGIETFGNRGGSSDVGEEHRDRPALARPRLGSRSLGIRDLHTWADPKGPSKR